MDKNLISDQIELLKKSISDKVTSLDSSGLKVKLGQTVKYQWHWFSASKYKRPGIHLGKILFINGMLAIKDLGMKDTDAGCFCHISNFEILDIY